MADERDPLLELKGVSKRFGAVQALDRRRLRGRRRRGRRPGRRQRRRQVDADQDDRRASSPPDAGEIRFEGEPATHRRAPADATALGIATVYQDLALCDNLDVVANLFLGQEELDGGRASLRQLDEIAMEQRSVELLDSLAVTIAERAHRGRHRSPAGSASRSRSRARCSASRSS